MKVDGKTHNVKKESHESERISSTETINDSRNCEKTSSNYIEILVEHYFGSYSTRIKNFITRTILTLILIILLPILIFGGPLIDFLIILTISVQSYREIIRVGYSQYKHHSLPLFRSLGWYIYMILVYFFVGELPINYFSVLIGDNLHSLLINHHKFISFCAFLAGMIVFVLTLKKNYLKMQFALFAWFILSSLIVIIPMFALFKNMQVGIIWVFLPMTLIVANDIFAYIFGIFFGKTPLIKLSPKKTWEGFIGGGIATLIISLILYRIMVPFPFFYCPNTLLNGNHGWDVTCKLPSYLMKSEIELPSFVRQTTFNRLTKMSFAPAKLHFFAIALFVSLLAPFGGFMASGFKRAFKIKDFGQAFPGHGGMLDRMDCQFLLTVFVNVYISSFLTIDMPEKILSQIFKLKFEDQLKVFNKLQEYLDLGGSCSVV